MMEVVVGSVGEDGERDRVRSHLYDGGQNKIEEE